MNKVSIIIGVVIVLIIALSVGFYLTQKKQANTALSTIINKTTSEQVNPSAVLEPPGMSPSCNKLYNLITSSYGLACGSLNFSSTADLSKDTYVKDEDLAIFTAETKKGTNESVCMKYLSDTSNLCAAKHPKFDWGEYEFQ